MPLDPGQLTVIVSGPVCCVHNLTMGRTEDEASSDLDIVTDKATLG
jgi:hypothetical protein